MLEKECRKCFKIKSVSEFHKSGRLPDGLQTWCKPCINAYKVARRTRMRTPEDQVVYERMHRNKRSILDGVKECSRCNKVKPLLEFYDGEGAGNTRADCAECHGKRHVNKTQKPYKDRLLEYAAQRVVRDAIRKGQIVKPKACTVCNIEPIIRRRSRIEFHHTDGYEGDSKSVGIFLCSRCHHKVHRGKLNVTGKQWL